MPSTTATPSTPAPAALAPCDKLTGATNGPQTAVTTAALAWFRVWEEMDYPGRPADAPAETNDEFPALCDAMHAAGMAVVAVPSETHADVVTKLVYWAFDNADTAPNCAGFDLIADEARQLVDPALHEPIERRDLVREMRRRIQHLPPHDPWDSDDVFFRRSGGLRNTPTVELRREVERLQKRTKGRRRRYAKFGPGGGLVTR